MQQEPPIKSLKLKIIRQNGRYRVANEAEASDHPKPARKADAVSSSGHKAGIPIQRKESHNRYIDTTKGRENSPIVIYSSDEEQLNEVQGEVEPPTTSQSNSFVQGEGEAISNNLKAAALDDYDLIIDRRRFYRCKWPDCFHLSHMRSRVAIARHIRQKHFFLEESELRGMRLKDDNVLDYVEVVR